MTVRTYTKQPVDVDAIQWTGDNEAEIAEFVGMYNFRDPYVDDQTVNEPGFQVIPETREARLWVEANDTWLPIVIGEWILKDSKGCYPCKDDVFAVTYRDKEETKGLGLAKDPELRAALAVMLGVKPEEIDSVSVAAFLVQTSVVTQASNGKYTDICRVEIS